MLTAWRHLGDVMVHLVFVVDTAAAGWPSSSSSPSIRSVVSAGVSLMSSLSPRPTSTRCWSTATAAGLPRLVVSCSAGRQRRLSAAAYRLAHFLSRPTSVYLLPAAVQRLSQWKKALRGDANTARWLCKAYKNFSHTTDPFPGTWDGQKFNQLEMVITFT